MSTRSRADAQRAIGIACCVALAAQYGAQPLLVRAFVPREVSRASLVLATEATKAALAVAIMRARGSLRDECARSVASGRRGALFAALPAVLYAIQNVLIQQGVANLDAVSFNCLNQSKLASAAVFVYIFSGVRQSFAQCVALLGVMGAGAGLSARGATASAPTGERDFAFGALAVGAASALSGLSGALGQVVLKRHGKSAPMLTLEMAIVGAPVVVLTEYFFAAPGASFDASALFAHWNALVWIPVFTAAVAGLLVGEITKRLKHGVIAKGFAVVGGLVLTGVCQSALTRERVPRTHVVCLFVVLTSVYVHTVSPPVDEKNKVA